MDVDVSLLEREREIATLERLLDQTRDARGGVVLIEGPAGIGKSRLLAAARERGGDMTVLTRDGGGAGAGAQGRRPSRRRALPAPARRAGGREGQALELAEACGCTPLVESVRSELYATGARPRTTALAGVESLTARELRVAMLAADGQTNREIAQALFVTPKTVVVHLSSAYRKLDIRSRRELAGALGASA